MLCLSLRFSFKSCVMWATLRVMIAIWTSEARVELITPKLGDDRAPLLLHAGPVRRLGPVHQTCNAFLHGQELLGARRRGRLRDSRCALRVRSRGLGRSVEGSRVADPPRSGLSPVEPSAWPAVAAVAKRQRVAGEPHRAGCPGPGGRRARRQRRTASSSAAARGPLSQGAGQHRFWSF